MLKGNGIEVWLEDQDGNVLPHGKQTKDGNEISAIVEIEGGVMYVVHWRRARGFKPISAWNDVFVVDTSSKSRKAAVFWMNEQEPDTQTRSSERLEARFRNGLKTPRAQSAKLGAVRLHIRRARGEIIVECVKDHPDDLDDTGKDEIDIDLIDDRALGKPPWIVFSFNFNNAAHGRRQTSGSHDAPASGTSLRSDDEDIPLRRLTRKQARQAHNSGDGNQSDSSDVPLRNPKRRKAFNAPSGSDSSSYVDDAQAPPPRTPKRNRQKSATPELDDEHPDAAQTRPSRKPKRPRKKSPSPSSNSSLDEHQEDKATKLRRDFPTPVSHQAPDDSDDEAAVLRRRLQESQQDYEEKRRKFQKDKEIEELFKKQIEMERKKKKLDAENDAQKKRIAKLRREVNNT